MIASSLASPQILPIRQPPIPPEKEPTRTAAFSAAPGKPFADTLDATRANQQAKVKAEAESGSAGTERPAAQSPRERGASSAPAGSGATQADKAPVVLKAAPPPGAETQPGGRLSPSAVARQTQAEASAGAAALAAASAALPVAENAKAGDVADVAAKDAATAETSAADALKEEVRKPVKEPDAVDPSPWAALLAQPAVPRAENDAVSWASTEPPHVSDDPEAGLENGPSGAAGIRTAVAPDPADTRSWRLARSGPKTDAASTDRQAPPAPPEPASAATARNPAPGAASADARGDTLPLGFDAGFDTRFDAGSDAGASAGALAALSAKADGARETKPGVDDRLGAAAAAAATAATAASAAVTGMAGDTLASAGAAARLAATPGTPEFATQLGTTLATFARRGVEHARLELNPAEMGPLTIQIKLEGVRALVHLAAEHEQTRQALEQSMPQLAGSLREAGLTLSGGGVSEQPPRQPPLPPDWDQQDERERTAREMRRTAEVDGAGIGPGRAEAAGARPLVGRRGVVDLVA